eukprot:10297117-Karenia_brevis.AAC.1
MVHDGSGLGQVGAKLAPSVGQVRPSWDQIGAKLGPSWGKLGQDGTKLSELDQVGPDWDKAIPR